MILDSQLNESYNNYKLTTSKLIIVSTVGAIAITLSSTVGVNQEAHARCEIKK